MQATLYDQYAMAALAGMTVNISGIDSIEGVAERASSIAIEMLELRQCRYDKIRELEAEYLDGMAVDRQY